jgi:hypothetical protein
VDQKTKDSPAFKRLVCYAEGFKTLGLTVAGFYGKYSEREIQSRVFTGLVTVHDTLKIHLYIMGMIDSPSVGGVEQRR